MRGGNIHLVLERNSVSCMSTGAGGQPKNGLSVSCFRSAPSCYQTPLLTILAGSRETETRASPDIQPEEKPKTEVSSCGISATGHSFTAAG